MSARSSLAPFRASWRVIDAPLWPVAATISGARAAEGAHCFPSLGMKPHAFCPACVCHRISPRALRAHRAAGCQAGVTRLITRSRRGARGIGDVILVRIIDPLRPSSPFRAGLQRITILSSCRSRRPPRQRPLRPVKSAGQMHHPATSTTSKRTSRSQGQSGWRPRGRAMPTKQTAVDEGAVSRRHQE